MMLCSRWSGRNLCQNRNMAGYFGMGWSRGLVPLKLWVLAQTPSATTLRVRQHMLTHGGRTCSSYWEQLLFPCSSCLFSGGRLVLTFSLLPSNVDWLSLPFKHNSSVFQCKGKYQNVALKATKGSVISWDDMKPIELQEMITGSYLWSRKAGNEWNHCAYESHQLIS